MSPMGNLSGETTWLLKSELLDIVPKGFLAYTAAYKLVRNSKPRNVSMWLTAKPSNSCYLCCCNELGVAPGLICRVYEVADADMV